MFIAYGGARGGGRLHALTLRYGYQRIILESVRMKVKYPFWEEIDEIIERYLDWLRWEESIYWAIRNEGIGLLERLFDRR
jgi:hypothetical protein